MKELWNAIPGFPGYEASNLGRVRSIPRLDRLGRRTAGKLLAHFVDKNNRSTVYPCISGKNITLFVHRAVLLAHVGECPAGQEACHFDDNPQNNRLGNLRWDTRAGNNADKRRNGGFLRQSLATAKLTDAQVLALRTDTRTFRIIAAELGVNASAVCMAFNGDTFAHLPMPDAIKNKQQNFVRGPAHHNAKLTAETVKALRQDTHLLLRELADKYGVSMTTAAKVRDGTAWAHV